MQERKQKITEVDLIKKAKILSTVFSTLKGSIFLKNRHFIIHERFDKLIYGINKIIK